MSGTAEA